MGMKTVRTVLRRVLHDRVYLELMIGDPDAALSGQDLTPAEIDNLKSHASFYGLLKEIGESPLGAIGDILGPIADLVGRAIPKGAARDVFCKTFPMWVNSTNQDLTRDITVAYDGNVELIYPGVGSPLSLSGRSSMTITITLPAGSRIEVHMAGNPGETSTVAWWW